MRIAANFWLITPAVILLAGIAVVVGLHRKSAESDQRLDGWRPISGQWSRHGDLVSNTHFGRGDMLIMQRSPASDYRIAADIRFDLLFAETHYGDAGLIMRTTDPQPGVDSYKGYYAGLRPDSQTVFLGRASYDWRLLAEKKLTTPFSTGDWYHLELAAHGCTLEVVATPVSGRPGTRIDYQDAHCLSSGVGGLRSFYAQASWRNVSITAD